MAHQPGPHLIDVKLALAEKYERRSKTAKSKPRRFTMRNRAERYRRQAEQIRRELDKRSAQQAQ